MKPLIYVVGFGPGDRPYMTQQAIDAVTQADLVVGYTTYIQLLEEQFPELRYYATPMRKETDRCRAAVEAALTGKTVALVSSGDSGIYGMAGVLLEIAAEMQADVEIIAVPGVTAASAAAVKIRFMVVSPFRFVVWLFVLFPGYCRGVGSGRFSWCGPSRYPGVMRKFH